MSRICTVVCLSTALGACAAQPASERPPPAAAAVAPPAAEVFTCTMLVGINATAEWFDKGFETLVDGDKWELVRVHSGFIERWADPESPFWKTAITSPCAQGSTTPDRIIFVALNFDYTTVDQWLPPLTATVKNLRARYPSARRIELMTFVRAPGNQPCPQREPKRSTIAPAEDEALALVAQANPELVRVAPRFEARACDEFTGNPPHPSAAGGAAWAQLIARHYGLGR